MQVNALLFVSHIRVMAHSHLSENRITRRHISIVLGIVAVLSTYLKDVIHMNCR